MVPNDNAVCVREGYFQIGRSEPGYPMGRKRGIHAGCTVKEAVCAVLQYRSKAKRTNEKMWLAVFVKRDDGMGVRFTATFEPEQIDPIWEISG